MQDYSTNDYSSDRSFESFAKSTTVDHDHFSDDGSNDEHRFNLLSFLSVITYFRSGSAEEAAILRLLAIRLGEWNVIETYSQYHGQHFSVTLLSQRVLLSATNTSLGLDELASKLYAAKTPRPAEDHSSLRNSMLFRSMSTEYQILKYESLKSHANVIKLFGCCWQSLDIYARSPIPCLILEGTKLGDLANFSRTKDLSLRE